MFLTLLLATLGALGADAEVTADIVVSPSGNDANAGTMESPLQSLGAARDLTRTRLKEGAEQNFIVMLRQGVYPLAQALQLGPEDGGSATRSVTYMAWPGELAVVSGGRPVTGWQRGDRNQWSTTIPEVAAGTWRFRDLWADGTRLPRGRIPNSPELARVAGVSPDLTGIVLDISPGVENLAGSNAELVMYQNWSISRVLIASSNDRTLKMTNPMGWVGHGDATCASNGKPAYIENALAFVDVPGEWYLDEATGVLTYQAAEGEDPNLRTFIAPVADQLIAVEGNSAAPVRNLHFEGLQFAHTRWELPAFGYLGIQAGHYGTTTEEPTFVLPTALSFIRAEGCSIRNCRITSTGSGGVGFGAGARESIVSTCTIADIGGNGVMVGWRGAGTLRPASKDEDQYLSADWSQSEDVPINNTITGNTIERCGAVNHGCVGIFDAFAQGTAITHNVIHDLPYTGISSGFRWNESATSQKEGVIAYNHVFDVMKMLADGGCLYTLGYQPGAVIRGNIFHGARRSEFAVGGAPNNGIFFDQGSKGFLVEGNTIYDTSGEPIRFNQTSQDNMTWKDNQFGVGAK